MGNCCQCDCPCCCHDSDTDSGEEEEKYPEEIVSDGNKNQTASNYGSVEIPNKATKRKAVKGWKRSKHLKIDYFNRVAVEIIKYKIAPYLFVYEQIALSRINKTFAKLFTMSTFNYSQYAQLQKRTFSYFIANIDKATFLDEHCNKVGKCAFMEFSSHERKLLLYFMIARHEYDVAIHLWTSNTKTFKLQQKARVHCHKFIANLLNHLEAINKFKQITFCDIFTTNNNFLKYFIQTFCRQNITLSNKHKFNCLNVLNLDFNQGINDKNCERLLDKCIIPNVCPNLKVLNLSHTNISDKSCKLIATFYMKHIGVTKLNRFHLDDNYKITSGGVDKLDNILKKYCKYAPLKNADTEFRIKNELNKRNWRLYKPYWDRKIVTGYKPPVRKAVNVKRKGKNKPSSGAGSAY